MSCPYNTINIQPQIYERGFFSVGTGPEVVLILGSCRVVPYFNYLHYLNTDNRFTICIVDVVKFYYNPDGTAASPPESTKRYEAMPELLEMLAKCKYFLHEFTESFGLFNTSLEAEKNIYQFRMNAEVDVSIPNFNNAFVLFQEFVNYDTDIRAGAAAHTKEWQAAVRSKGLLCIDNFLNICKLTNLSEFGEEFGKNWRTTRYFWTGNHVSSKFTELAFRLINDKFLHIPTTDAFWNRVRSEDLYATPCTKVTIFDVENYGLHWPQTTIEELQIP